MSRSATFDRRSTPCRPSSATRPLACARIVGLGDQLGSILGFSPVIRIDGPIDATIPEAMGEDVIAVVRESLSNIAKHAGASRVEVTIDVHSDVLSLVVRDDGIGIDANSPTDGSPPRRSGLANLESRALQHGGAFEAKQVTDGEDEWSTVLTWTAPLAR